MATRTPQSIWDLLDRPPSGLKPFAVEGPWNINDPVHETITRESLRAAGLIGAGATAQSPEAWEFIRGAIWNDDPEGLLFHSGETRTDHYSTGFEWVLRFREAEKLARRGEVPGPGRSLTARSHFGDLQFLHGMAAADGVAAEETRDTIIAWAEFAWRTARGESPAQAPLAESPVAQIRNLLGGTKLTAGALFCCTGAADLRKRALGSLLHTLQDSFAAGHVQREPGTLRIVSFHSYAHQDHQRHAADDGWRGAGTDLQKLATVHGALDAVDRGARVLKLFTRGAAWPAARDLLLEQVWPLSAQPQASGPGTDYRVSSRSTVDG